MRRNQSLGLGLGLVVLCLAANPAAARRYDRPHQHGLLLRLSGGIGYGSETFDNDRDTGFQGGAVMGSFAIGGNIAPGLALDVDFFGMTMFAPTVIEDGDDVGEASNTRVNVGGIGVGITGYIAPVNIYLAASVGAAVGTTRTKTPAGTLEFDSDPGFAMNLMIGKEWLVSPAWGVGLAGQVIYAALDDGDADSTNAFGVGVLLSATYN